VQFLIPHQTLATKIPCHQITVKHSLAITLILVLLKKQVRKMSALTLTVCALLHWKG